MSDTFFLQIQVKSFLCCPQPSGTNSQYISISVFPRVCLFCCCCWSTPLTDVALFPPVSCSHTLALSFMTERSLRSCQLLNILSWLFWHLMASGTLLLRRSIPLLSVCVPLKGLESFWKVQGVNVWNHILNHFAAQVVQWSTDLFNRRN